MEQWEAETLNSLDFESVCMGNNRLVGGEKPSTVEEKVVGWVVGWVGLTVEEAG